MKAMLKRKCTLRNCMCKSIMNMTNGLIFLALDITNFPPSNTIYSGLNYFCEKNGQLILDDVINSYLFNCFTNTLLSIIKVPQAC